MTRLTIVHPPAHETMEQLQARLAHMAKDTLSEFMDRLDIMVADAERLSKLDPLPPGYREEVRQLGVKMREAALRVGMLRERGL